MITKLKNPKTDSYRNVKDYILSKQFPWYRASNMVSNTDEPIIVENGISHHNIPFFSHIVIRKPVPNQKYPIIFDEWISEFDAVINEIFDYNNLQLNCIYRMSVNLVQYTKEELLTPLHRDHPWPHNNILIYMTDAGGETICEDKSFDPSEDDIIIFSGYPERHCYKTSTKKDRIVMVATYI